MGLSHILYLKEHIKGALFALLEVIFLVCLPFTFIKVKGLITLGGDQSGLAVKDRSNSVRKAYGGAHGRRNGCVS